MRSGLILRLALTALLPLVFLTGARAQFVLSNTDDGLLKWMSIQSPNFKVIYPIGCDSLARAYLVSLEQQRPRVASSLGMAANENRKNPLPVVLHTQNDLANGLVVWTPRRMELNTIPEWTSPSPMPWTTMLTIHEGRHAAQMSNGYRKVFFPFYCVFGEIIPGIAAGWPGQLFLEGDAVIAETALSSSGRGRSADFLQYYNYAFNTGDYRNWMKWRLGSYYKYTPDHYAFGYALLSGIRTRYDVPLFMADYFDYVSRRPYDPWPFRHTLRRNSGKRFKESYPEVLTANYEDWLADTASRAPFVPYTVFSPATRTLTEYSNPNSAPDGGYLWIKKDIYHTPAFMELTPEGGQRKLFNISSTIGKMNYEERDSTLFWNEVRKDPRWGHKRKSLVRSYNFTTGKLSTVSKLGHYLYPIEIDSARVAVIHYLEDGREHVNLLDRHSGDALGYIEVPDSLQVLEITHVADSLLYAVAISENGCGFYSFDFTDALPDTTAHDEDGPRAPGWWKMELQPHPFSVRELEHDGNTLVFQSDRSGVNEYYRYDPATRTLTQLTSSLYGGLEFNLCPNSDVSYSVITKNGSAAVVTKAEDLLNKVVDWDDYHHYAVADKLSEQEKTLARIHAKDAVCTEISAPRRYRKAGHGIHLHSWAPLYADVDALSSMSLDNLTQIAHLGAMGFFQNDLSTFSGWVGYQAKLVEPGKGDGGSSWRNVGHLKITYSGIYPEFEGEVHINEDVAREYFYKSGRPKKQSSTDTLFYKTCSYPRLRAQLTVRIPLSWDDGVTQYGFIPYIGLGYTNDILPGKTANVLYNLGARGYVMTHTASAAIYPRLGIGTDLRLTESSAYAYLYGYVPGVGWGQGLKLSAIAQKRLKEQPIYVSSYANMLPRGYANVPSISGLYSGFKITSDYAAPFYMGDWHIGDAFYCTRGIVTPHFDCSYLETGSDNLGTLWSAGLRFEMEFASFFWVRTPIKVGVSWSYNGGSLYSFDQKYRNYVGATFSTSLF